MVSKSGFSAHSGAAKRRSLALPSRPGRDPASCPRSRGPWPRPARPRYHASDRPACLPGRRPAERRWKRPRAALPAGHRLTLLHPVSPGLHDHLLGPAHHPGPMLPVLERGIAGRRVRLSVMAAFTPSLRAREAIQPSSGLLRRSAPRNDEEMEPPHLPHALVLLDLFRHRGVRGVRARCSPRKSVRHSSPSSSSRS